MKLLVLYVLAVISYDVMFDYKDDFVYNFYKACIKIMYVRIINF